MAYSKEDVKDLIELEDVCTLLEYLDAEPQIYSDYLISKTICHGGESHKLYYYDTTKLFKCYTHCDDAFDIFELVQKVLDIQNLNQAVYWVVNFFNLTHKLEDADLDYSSDDWKIFNRYDRINNLEVSNKELELQTYNPSILEFYPQPEIIPWTKEGITKEVCDYMNIRYDPVNGSILIPHTNENNELVGIRQRTLVQEDEKYGKYRPWKLGKQLYNHPLGFNLYSSPDFWENIQKSQMAIVFEGEKSVLKYVSYFGTKNNIACAVCGNTLSKYQFQLLQKYGVKDIVLAFDKDYTSLADEKYDEVVTHWEKIYKKFCSECNMSVLLDTENFLGLKDSPIDKGKDVFLYLFRNRFIG